MKFLEGLRVQARIAQCKFEASNLYSHNLTKGEVRERVLENFLRPFLPPCYGLGSGQVFSSDGNDSRQVDIVIYDAIFSIVLRFDERHYLLPCESVFGSVEVKSRLNSEELTSAVANVRSLKTLKRAASDQLDFTPISRLDVGSSLTYGRTIKNPYLGVVFALDGLNGEAVRDNLVQTHSTQRESLPDYVFNLEKQYMVSRWVRRNSGKPDIDCRVDPYDGFVLVPLGDDILPVFYLTLNTMLNRTRLKQPDVGKTWIETINARTMGFEMASWARPR